MSEQSETPTMHREDPRILVAFVVLFVAGGTYVMDTNPVLTVFVWLAAVFTSFKAWMIVTTQEVS